MTRVVMVLLLAMFAARPAVAGSRVARVSEAWHDAANALRNHQPLAAIEAARTCLSLRPRLPACERVLGRALAERYQCDEALVHLAIAARASDTHETLEARARCLVWRGDDAAAADLLDHANDADADLLFTRALINVDRGMAFDASSIESPMDAAILDATLALRTADSRVDVAIALLNDPLVLLTPQQASWAAWLGCARALAVGDTNAALDAVASVAASGEAGARSLACRLEAMRRSGDPGPGVGIATRIESVLVRRHDVGAVVLASALQRGDSALAARMHAQECAGSDAVVTERIARLAAYGIALACAEAGR